MINYSKIGLSIVLALPLLASCNTTQVNKDKAAINVKIGKYEENKKIDNDIKTILAQGGVPTTQVTGKNEEPAVISNSASDLRSLVAQLDSQAVVQPIQKSGIASNPNTASPAKKQIQPQEPSVPLLAMAEQPKQPEVNVQNFELAPIGKPASELVPLYPSAEQFMEKTQKTETVKSVRKAGKTNKTNRSQSQASVLRKPSVKRF